MSEPLIIAIANQKGGVGKTTTAVNLGAGLSRHGHRVLLVDLDPQGNASTGLGVSPGSRKLTSYDLLTGKTGTRAAAVDTGLPNLRLIPSTNDLNGVDIELATVSRRAHRLAAALARTEDADIILLDCPPALGVLTINAMVAADAVLVPLQAELYALEGLSQLIMTIRQIRDTANARLRIEGVVLTMTDGRTSLSQQVEADARATLEDLVYETVIPRNVRISEAPSHGVPVIVYDPSSRGAKAYEALAKEFLSRHTERFT